MANPRIDEYARILSGLSGDDFQNEVSARLAAIILDFQPVPDAPRGDAGLDAYSHSRTHGYCCYGLEHREGRNNRGREAAIVKKFCSDLRRLFELDVKNGGKTLVHKDNPELVGILKGGARLVHIKLVCNWFDSHRILGRIHAKVDEYRAASRCRCVDPAVTVVVMGPEQLANDYALDELTIARAQQRTLIDRVQVAATTVSISDSKDFDSKMRDLGQIRPDQPLAIQKLADSLRHHWRTAIAFERELGDSLPGVHRALENARIVITTRVAQLMIGSSEPWTQLDRSTDIAAEALREAFGASFDVLVAPVASGEIARIIGECTISWTQATKQTNG